MNIQQIYINAENLYSQGNYKEALKLFYSIMDDYETYSAACYYGCCLTRLGKYEKSIGFFNQLLTMCSNWESVWYNLGDAYLKKGDKTNARRCFFKAEEIAPEHPCVLFYLGLYYEKEEDYYKAISYYERSLILNNCFETNASLAVCYYAVDKFNKALLYSKAAFELKPYNIDSLFYYTRLLVKNKKYKEAVEVFESTDLKFDNDSEVLITYIICYLRTGNEKKADVAYKKLKKVDSISNMVCDYEKIKNNILGNVN